LRLVIQFHTEYLVNRSGSLEKRLLHEMVHGAMRRALGDDRYVRIPLWLREGLAVSIAGQGVDRVRYEFTITLDVRALLNGLDSRHEPRDYAEDFLAVDYLIRCGGSGSRLHLMNLLLAGKDAGTAVRTLARLKDERFEEVFERDVLPTLEKAAAPELMRFLPAYRLFQDGKYAQALASFRTRTPVRKTSLLAGALDGKALYYTGKCLFNLGRFTDARAAFTTVREDFASRCGLADDAAFFEAECLFRENRIPDARAAFHRFVRDFPYSNFAAPGYQKLGLCAYLQGDFEEAQRTCLATWKAFPREPVAENALYDASNAARARGDVSGALDLFRSFLKAYPKSRFRSLAEARIRELEGTQ
jgi:TolA-binding protein